VQLVAAVGQTSGWAGRVDTPARPLPLPLEGETGECGVRRERGWIGVTRTCTATEMSAAWKRRTVSPIQLAFTSGTFMSASADALMIRSVTDSFPPLFSNPLFSIDRACRHRHPSRVTQLSSAASASRTSDAIAG